MIAVTSIGARMQTHRRPLAELVDLSGLLAGWCDRAEHNEGVGRDELLAIGARLRTLGLGLLDEAGLEPVAAYADRLRQMEAKNVLLDADGDDLPSRLAAPSASGRTVQLVQAAHDRAFHPDVVGLPRAQQLQHYALHLAKLARYLQLAGELPEEHGQWMAGRVADALIFGVKLATVANHRLPDTPLADGV